MRGQFRRAAHPGYRFAHPGYYELRSPRCGAIRCAVAPCEESRQRNRSRGESMVTFNNSYTNAALNSPHTHQYLNAIAAAEQLISANWTNPITLNITFDLQANGTG